MGREERGGVREKRGGVSKGRRSPTTVFLVESPVSRPEGFRRLSKRTRDREPSGLPPLGVSSMGKWDVLSRVRLSV